MKINFKKPKYIIPAIIFLPLIWIGWQVVDVFKTETKVDTTVQTESINTDMPNPNMEDLELKSKYQNMMDDFGRARDYAAVQGIDAEEKENNDGIMNSLYSDREIASIDSLEEAKKRQLEELREIQSRQMQNEHSGNYSYADNTQNYYSNQKKENNQSDEAQQTDELHRQLLMLQKIANGERIDGEESKTTGEKKESATNPEREEQQKKIAKVEKISKDYFNTITNEKNSNENNLIKAMVDQALKVVDGSRIRLRLMDDVNIEGSVIPKGTYLYAIVSGFGSQRVKAEITSILFKSKHIKVSLSLYDTDGIEGLYVPESAFRDLQNEASSQALSQNFNMQSSAGEQNMESMMYQTLQNIYQSASSAISNNIKKNKAQLKYNTTVYLINDK
jgi:conjugative transposon TraM protein